MEKKQIAESAAEKFTRLDEEAKEFVLGYLIGKRDEKAAKASA